MKVGGNENHQHIDEEMLFKLGEVCKQVEDIRKTEEMMVQELLANSDMESRQK